MVASPNSTIGTGTSPTRNYSTVTQWLQDLPTDIVGSGNSYVGTLYNDSVFNNVADNGMSFSGFTTDATHTITLTVAAGQSFVDNANAATNALRFNPANGVSFVQPGDHTFVFNVGSSYVTISRIQAQGTGGGIPRFCFITGSNCAVRNSIFEAPTKNSNTGVVYSDAGSGYYNCLIVSRTSNQIAIEPSSGSKIINCTAVRCSDDAIAGYGVSPHYNSNVIRNCAMFGFTDCLPGSNTDADGHNCVDSATTCPGTVGNLLGKSRANQFVNTVYATQDWRLKTGADCINAGVTDTTNIPTATDIIGTARPQGASWDIGCWEAPPSGPPPVPWFDRHVDVGYMPPPRRIFTIRRVVAPPPAVTAPAGAKTFYTLNTTATSPWWGVLQEGGIAPTAASSAYGWKPGTTSTATSYYRARLGATGTSTDTATAGSYIDGTAGPTLGGGSATTGGTGSGDSFVSPSTYNGNFAAGNWVFTWGMRCGNINSPNPAGQMRVRVWASTNPNGSAPRQLTSGTLVGSTATFTSVLQTFTSSITWAAPAITLNNEYLFFQVEWRVITAGGSVNNTALFYQSAASILTSLFSQPLIGSLNVTAAGNTISAAGTVTGGNITGALNLTQANQTISAAGTVPITGTLAITQGDQTLSAAGTVVTPSPSVYLVASYTPGGDRNDYTGGVGFVFTLAHGDTYNKIGVRKGTSNTGLHTVGLYIWNADPTPLTTLRTATVDLTSGTVGNFYYADITPITLTTSYTYALLVEVVASDGQFWATNGPTTLNNDGGYVQYAARDPGGHGTAGSYQQFAGVDLAYVSAGPPPITGALAITQANQTIAAIGNVPIAGTLAVTQANQTISAVGNLPITGTLAVTQANQTIAAIGNVPITGTLARTQADQTISAAGGPVAGGILAVTQANQTIAAQGTLGTITGTLAVTQANQTIAAQGSVLTGTGGALVLTQANQTILATGTVPASTSGTLAVTQANQTISTAGNLPITGTLAVIQATQGISAAGGPVAGGALAVTQADQTINGIGNVRVGGTLAVTQADQTIITAGGPRVSGTLGITQANQTILAQGWQSATGTLVVPQASQTIIATGSALSGIGGAVVVTQANQTIAAQGTPGAATGTLAKTQADQTISAAGGPVAGGILAVTQANQTIAAQGKVSITGTLARIQADQTINATAGTTIVGQVSITELIDTINAIGRIGAEQARVIMMA